MRVLFGGWAKCVAAALLIFVLAGCAGVDRVKTGTVSRETLSLMESMNMDRGAPMLVRIYKEGSTLEVWKEDRAGRYRLLKSYPICRFSGGLGPKKQEGDHQAPEGFYEVTPGQMNPNSREYLAFNLGYPNAFDRALGRTGDSLMVHGGCRSVGCYAMTNEGIEEIFGLAHEVFAAGQDVIQVQAFPFRMTTQNLDRFRTDANQPFWATLKEGSDRFEVAGRPVDVSVCDGRYVFASVLDATVQTGQACTGL